MCATKTKEICADNLMMFLYCRHTEFLPAANQVFLVFGSCLRILLLICSVCGGASKPYVTARRGSAICIERICRAGHRMRWGSQPYLGKLARGNLVMASSILLSGCSPVKALNFFAHANIPAISYRTYNRLQRLYLVPAVGRVWSRMQAVYFQEIRY
jgi:hypothetical protein